MKTLISIFLCLTIISVVSGCAGQQRNSGNSPDEQRAHAEKAQGELSTETRK